MNIIPKLYGGGDISSLFTTYRPTQTPQVQAPQSVKLSNSDKESLSIKSSSKDEDKEDTKGKLTEKDVFDMIKDISGLPNEMKSIITSLKRTMTTENLVGIDTGELNTVFLNNLYKLKIANNNKIKFDESVKTAKENGSLGEVAITLGGNLLSENKNGSIQEVSLQQFKNNPEQYNIITNARLAELRKYSPKMAFSGSDNIFDIINNGVGFESFQKVLDTAKTNLGNYKFTEQGIAGKEALQGLKAFQNASTEKQKQYIQDALDGKYSYTSEVSTNENNIKAYLGYLVTVLPKRMKVWAALKTGISDENQASLTLVGQYLQGKLTTDTNYQVSYLGTSEKLQRASSRDGSGSSSEPVRGFWQQVQTDQGGDTQNYQLVVGKGSMSVTGKFYGTTPGMDENTSLTKYIANSKVGYLIKNRRGITFGDQTLSIDSFDDVMVNANGGAMVATLPITPDGKVNFEILNTYTTIENKLKATGYNPGTKEFEKAKASVIKKIGLGYLVDAQSGLVNPKYFGHFLILEGVASDKAKVLGGENKLQNLGNTDFIKDASSDDQLFDVVKKALSDKDKGEYKLDNNWISFNNTKLYKGNIFIPINQNNINGANADNSNLKNSQAYDYEEEMQRQEERQNNWEKEQNKQSTNSNVL